MPVAEAGCEAVLHEEQDGDSTGESSGGQRSPHGDPQPTADSQIVPDPNCSQTDSNADPT